MSLRPLHDRILVERLDEAQQRSSGGIIIPDSAKEKPQQGQVVAVGNGKKKDDGSVVALDVQVGDKILFGKYSGSEVTVNDNEYLIMREDEALAIIS